MLIDANVFNGFFRVDLGKPHLLQGCPYALFNQVSAALPIYHDNGKIIEHEWRNVVDPDWFEAWFGTNLVAGHIAYVTAKKDLGTEKKILSAGFPNSRDLIYIRVALAAAKANTSCDFYTEDLDFYDPKMKGCKAKTRAKILQASSGSISKILSKSKIYIKCVP